MFDSVLQHSFANGNPYQREVLFRHSRLEVLLLRWNDNVPSAPHDHGYSAGLVFVLRGRLFERTWEFRRDELIPTNESMVQAPCMLPVDRGRIHDVRAEGGAVSLHIYSPAISHMKVFDPMSKRTLLVSDDCGAWIPREKSQILAQLSWNNSI